MANISENGCLQIQDLVYANTDSGKNFNGFSLDSDIASDDSPFPQTGGNKVTIKSTSNPLSGLGLPLSLVAFNQHLTGKSITYPTKGSNNVIDDELFKNLTNLAQASEKKSVPKTRKTRNKKLINKKGTNKKSRKSI